MQYYLPLKELGVQGNQSLSYLELGNHLSAYSPMPWELRVRREQEGGWCSCQPYYETERELPALETVSGDGFHGQP